jgi:hypothetical protein
MAFGKALIISSGIVAVAAGILLFMGRVPMCECGHISLWQGVVASPENSQQLSDWYSASHFIHGILFFWLFVWVVRLCYRRFGASSAILRSRFAGSEKAEDALISAKNNVHGIALIFATLFESGWEILENSPIIINRYREVTISWGYVGDSVLNSVSDILFMWAGFIFARYVPWWVSFVVILLLEIFVAYMIRDNLLLNILMLIYPSPAIRAWQAG